jgi:hypothetical protein
LDQGISATCKKEESDAEVILLYGDVQGNKLRAQSWIHANTSLEQDANDVDVPSLDGHNQWADPKPILRINLGANLDQPLTHSSVTHRARIPERRTALPVTPFHRVSSIDQSAHVGQVSIRRRID